MAKTPIPTREAGHPGGLAQAYTAGGEIAWRVDPFELTEELVFPDSMTIFQRMRREDGQIGSLLRAMTLPLLGAGRSIEGADVPPQIVEFVRTELGVTEPGASRRQARHAGILLADHLREALLCLPFGFSCFEQVYQVGPATQAQAAAGLVGQFAHLRKLGLRHPTTIREIRVDRDGGLAGVVQRARGDQPSPGRGRMSSVIVGQGSIYGEVVIPVNQLVFYSLDREGADWSGNSVLRQAYKHWLLRDVILRTGAQGVERQGMGLPAVYYAEDQGGNSDEALEIATSMRAGATAGLALKDKAYRAELIGVNGSTADGLEWANYHDQAMARSTLQMFLNLGHDNGARALGDTFVDYYTQSLNSVASWLADVVTEHVIRDLVELNFGPDAPYPELVIAPIETDSALIADALKSLSDAGIITPDDDLEEEVRRRMGLPPMGEPRKSATPAPTVGQNQGVNPFAPDQPANDDADETAGETDDGGREDTAAGSALAAGLSWRTQRLLDRLDAVIAEQAGQPGMRQ